jgi:hypothetical protein
MNRVVLATVALSSLVFAACGGSNKEAKNGGDDDKDWVVLNSKDVGDDAYKFTQAFALFADKHGCQVKQKGDEATLAVCKDGTIGMARQGTQVTVICKQMTKSECGALFDAIVNEGK